MGQSNNMAAMSKERDNQADESIHKVVLPILTKNKSESD